jgi:hypothetical protein
MSHAAAESEETVIEGPPVVADTEETVDEFALHAAARAGDEGAAAHLLSLPSAETMLKRRDAHERTPLHLACHANHAKVVSQLIAGGASVNATAKAGFGALHFACQAGAKDALQALLAGGAKPNVWEARKKNTPLHLAALKGNDACVTALLRAGADPLAKTKKGETPFDLGHLHAAVGSALRAHLEELQKGIASAAAAPAASEAADVQTKAPVDMSGAAGGGGGGETAGTKTHPGSAGPTAANGDAGTSYGGPETKCEAPVPDKASEESNSRGGSAEPVAKKRKKEKKPRGTLSLSHLEEDDGAF